MNPERNFPQQFLVSKQARLQNKDKTQLQGHISVYSDHILWQQDGATNKIVLNVQQIKGHQKAKGQGLLKIDTINQSYIFILQSVVDRDSVSDCISKILEKANIKPQVKANQKQQQSQQNFENKSAILIKNAKQKVLKENQDVQELYSQLVEGGLISENEFWNGRQDILHQQQAILLGQDVGLRNEMLQEVGPQIDVQKQEMKFSITKEYMQQVFAEKPEVKKAYDKNVPAHMTQEQFWGRYFRHVNNLMQKYQKQNLQQAEENDAKKGGAATLKQNFIGYDADQEYNEDGGENIFRRTKEDLKQDKEHKRQQAKVVDPTIDVAGDQYERYLEGYGNYHKSQTENFNNKKQSLTANDIIEDINRHAEVVLKGIPKASQESAQDFKQTQLSKKLQQSNIYDQYKELDQEEKIKFQERLKQIQEREGLALEDLIEPKEQIYEELNINDSSGYFAGINQQQPQDNQLNIQKQFQDRGIQNGQYSQQRHKQTPDQQNIDASYFDKLFQNSISDNVAIMQPESAQKVLQEITESIKDSSQGPRASNQLPQSISKTARGLGLASNELLKLSWKHILKLQSIQNMDNQKIKKSIGQEDKNQSERYAKSIENLTTRIQVLLALESLETQQKQELQVQLKPIIEALNYGHKALEKLQNN